MKQITIYGLLPLLKKGWVAYDEGRWDWFEFRPKKGEHYWQIEKGWSDNLSGPCRAFKIKPFDGDWKDSLIKVEHSKKKSIDRKDFDDFMEQHGVSPWGFLTEAILKEDFECWKKWRKNDKDTN